MAARNPLLIDLPLPIQTPRLLIRNCLPGDGQKLLEARKESDRDLHPWMPFARTEATLDDCEASCRQAFAKFILREDIRLSAFDRKTGEFIVSTGLHRFHWERGIFEIGYWVRSSRAGQGYVTEAVNAVTQYAFRQLRAKRVAIFCNTENQRSSAVAERLGFRKEARLAMVDKYASEEIDSRDEFVYARTAPEGMPALEVSW